MSIAQSVKHQDRLLTINIKDGEIKNALPVYMSHLAF